MIVKKKHRGGGGGWLKKAFLRGVTNFNFGGYRLPLVCLEGCFERLCASDVDVTGEYQENINAWTFSNLLANQAY